MWSAAAHAAALGNAAHRESSGMAESLKTNGSLRSAAVSAARPAASSPPHGDAGVPEHATQSGGMAAALHT